jgi:eukaryotic-like serine/threonine-protein kinase
MALDIGQVLDGKYQIVRLIGEGGMGAVYEGKNTRINRRVAIKVLHANVAANKEIVQRFEREAQVAGTVGNDHILEILDLGALPSGEHYMVMEFLEGETFTQRIKGRGRLQPAEAVAVLRQVLAGLGAAHGAGIVHRDLKPDNIFILTQKAGHRDYVKIIDFGISKFSEQGTASRMTRTGALMGTPHYMAPEQATGSADVDRRTDIYALGIILYEAVTGRLPFKAETFNQLLFEIALAKIIPARDLVPDLDPAIDTIIMKAAARDPAHRFQTTEAFTAALDAWEHTGAPVSLPPDQTLEAIVAATGVAAGGALAGAPVPRGSVGASPGVSGPGTVNSWANSQSGVVPGHSNTPILVATVAGMLLLVGGGIGAYFVFRSTPSDTAAAGASSAVEATATPSAVETQTGNPETKPAPEASAAAPSVAPATEQPASAPAAEKATRTPKTSSTTVAATASATKTKAAPAAAAASAAPVKKSINFGY